jgi:hypothetical protein
MEVPDAFKNKMNLVIERESNLTYNQLVGCPIQLELDQVFHLESLSGV